MHFEVARVSGKNTIVERIYHQKFSDLGLDLEGDIFEVEGKHLKEFDR